MNHRAGADGDDDVLQHKFVESSFLNGDLIGARIEIQKYEIALRPDCRVVEIPVFWLRTVMSAPGTAAPLESVTIPSSRPVAEADCD